jgi:dedicator of cytokinesis protein 3
MSGHDETCRSAVEILFSMIYAEYVVDGRFDVIETEVLAKLDKLVSCILPISDRS